jgi:hypothetical protein
MTLEFIEKAKKVHGNKYNYSKVNYVNNHTKVIIICKVHGEFLQRPYHHFAGQGCRECSNENRKFSKEKFIKKAKKVHGNKYNYSKVNYVNNHTKVIIICPKHSTFLQKPSNHLDGHRCKECSNEDRKFSKEKFIEEAKKIHGNKYDYSKVEYVNANKKVIIICPKHSEFLQRPCDHLNRNGCKECSNEDRKLSKEEFIEKAKKVHENKYDYSKVNYVNNHTKVIIICKVHGEFLQCPRDHLNGCGCKECFSEDRKLSKEEFIEKAKKVHGNKYNYSKIEYINSYTKIIMICPKHGEFLQKPSNHLNGQGCRYCHSCVSDISQSWLDDLGVPKEFREKIIKVCEQKYIVDAFYNNIIYEFNGDFWHGNPNVFDPNDINPIIKKSYGELYKMTLKKEKDLKNAGYNVISIWESDYTKE